MSSVGLEPTSANTIQLECTPLDHSGKMTLKAYRRSCGQWPCFLLMNPCSECGLPVHASYRPVAHYQKYVENEGIEPSASCVQGRRSTPELIPHHETSSYRGCLGNDCGGIGGLSSLLCSNSRPRLKAAIMLRLLQLFSKV